MREQDPHKSPEKGKPKPIFDDCNHCEKKYQITAINGKLFMFDKQPDCNYMLCQCSHCKGYTKMFLDRDSLAQGKYNGIPEQHADYADDRTYKQMLGIRGVELVESGEITERHEGYIRKLGAILRNMPDQDIQAEFALPQPPQRMAQKWR